MPKFVFQLEGVLRQRRTIEHERLRALAEIQQRFTQMETELRGMDHEVLQATAHLREHCLKGKLNMGYLAAHRRYTLAVQRKATTLMQRMTLLQRQIEQARLAVAAAAKQRKAVEKLRERQYERWRQAAEHRELAELDEISVQMSYQNLVEGS
jgi:flagellar FliJ protein